MIEIGAVALLLLGALCGSFVTMLIIALAYAGNNIKKDNTEGK